MSILSSAATVFETIAIWLDPDRKREVILREAISAAEEIINILENAGKYKDITEAKRTKLLIHFRKQFNAWRDGTP